MTPFINSCRTTRSQSLAFYDLFKERNNAGFEIEPQILGNEPEAIAATARVIADLGYKTVNWNLGCPQRRVVNKGRGSGLLAHPDAICRMLDEIVPALSIPLSLKVRLGNRDAGELARLLPLLDAYPLKEIVIHPRTAVMMYGGEADVEAFADLLPLTKHAVVYNGDIDTLDRFKFLQKRLPSVHRWMIGRGGISDPFLPELIKVLPGSGYSRERFVAFHDDFYAVFEEELDGPRRLLAKMKEMWFYWQRCFESGEVFYQTLSRIPDLDSYQTEVNEFWQKTDFCKKQTG